VRPSEESIRGRLLAVMALVFMVGCSAQAPLAKGSTGLTGSTGTTGSTGNTGSAAASTTLPSGLTGYGATIAAMECHAQEG
jgi:hypothetical protein